MQKNENGSLSLTPKKAQLQMDKGLQIRSDNLKMIEKKEENKLSVSFPESPSEDADSTGMKTNIQ